MKICGITLEPESNLFLFKLKIDVANSVKYDNQIDNEIFEKFDLANNANINIFEAYTETWTVILSSCIFSKISLIQ